jgi:Flp pilus assembly protein TadB
MSNLDNLRVSEAEREEASARLAEHYSTGRLSDDDYYERLDAVWSAKVRADLEMLFTDLPRSVPQPPQVLRRPRRGRPRAFPLVACFLLVAIGLMVMGVPWWVFAAIAVGALVFRNARHHGHHHRHYHGHFRHSMR